jgi:hypothetical protein
MPKFLASALALSLVSAGCGFESVSYDETEQLEQNLTEVEKALNRAASASSIEGSNVPGNAVDGNAATRYSSGYSDGQWWQVDLGSVQLVNKVSVLWEFAYASRYRILTSTDGTNFALAAEVTLSAAREEVTPFSLAHARYVRILCVTRATQWDRFRGQASKRARL